LQGELAVWRHSHGHSPRLVDSLHRRRYHPAPAVGLEEARIAFRLNSDVDLIDNILVTTIPKLLRPTQIPGASASPKSRNNQPG
jgi:hypothetical protein